MMLQQIMVINLLTFLIIKHLNLIHLKLPNTYIFTVRKNFFHVYFAIKLDPQLVCTFWFPVKNLQYFY